MLGPFSKSGTSGASPVQKEWTRYWYRTNPGTKVRTPLPYTYTVAERVTPVFSSVSAYAVSTTRSLVVPGYNTPLDNMVRMVHNRAYAKWQDKMKNGIQLGTDVFEGEQTLKMVNSTLKALRNPMRALAKACASPTQALAGGYLALHFGVEPLYKELFELLELLEKGIAKRRVVTAQARGTFTEKLSARGETQTRLYRTVVRHTAGVLVTDENLFSLNVLGVSNPVAIAWELVPYSFVVDWLYPVGMYLQQLDALLGVNLENPYTTTLRYLHHEVTRGWPVIFPSDLGANRLQVNKGFSMQRSLNTVTPVLQRTLNPWSSSITRALTSLSLVAQASARR